MIVIGRYKRDYNNHPLAGIRKLGSFVVFSRLNTTSLSTTVPLEARVSQPSSALKFTVRSSVTYDFGYSAPEFNTAENCHSYLSSKGVGRLREFSTHGVHVQ